MCPHSCFCVFGLNEDLFFGLIANDILYFKVDDSNRERYIAARASPFCPYGEDDYSMSYYEVPADILEDHEAVTQWAREAVKAAERKRSGKAATGASEKKKSKSKQRLNRRSRSTTKMGRPKGQ